MTIMSGYFNSISGDRKYNSETMSKYFAGLITRGVLQNYQGKFLVTANTGMNVSVATGKAYFTDGKWIESDSVVTLTLDPSDVILDRIDRVVLRKDMNTNARLGSLILKKGTPATSPVAPALESNDLVEEISLATIHVGKLVESISQSNITDTRADSDVCGFVTGLIKQVDTSDLYLQYQQAYDEQYEEFEQDFNEWFSQLREELSTSTLVREYTNRVYSAVEDQTVFDIGIAGYVQGLDILEVYVNGLRLVNNIEYTVTGSTTVTLANGVDINQPIEFVVFKSVDGNNAETVIEQVEELIVEVADLKQNKADRNTTTVTLNAGAWVEGTDEFTQAVSVNGVTESSVLIIASHPSNILEYGDVYGKSQAVNSVVFACTNKPDQNLMVNILNLGG